MDLFLERVSHLSVTTKLLNLVAYPWGLLGFISILSLFQVHLESSKSLNFHMGTCFSSMMCLTNTFFPRRIQFKMLIKEIPEEHLAFLTFLSLCLQNFGSSRTSSSHPLPKNKTVLYASGFLQCGLVRKHYIKPT